MKRIAVIGAGAAGCFCAAELRRSRPSVKVDVYESGAKPLAKVAITGGGRCNLTNSFEGIRSLGEAYPRGERLMKRLLRHKEQIAGIIDEYGSFQGIITLEDIIETIFGLEIIDELDEVTDMQQYARDRWKKRQSRFKSITLPEEQNDTPNA